MRVLRVLAAALCALGLSLQAEAAPDGVAKVRVAADNAFAGGDMKTAISLLSRLIELEPSNERNFYKRFRAYLSERKYSHALSDLTSSLAVNPSYKQGILQRGKLLMMLGQCADAVHDFERVVELYPSDATAAENLAKSTRCAEYINEAERAQSRGDYEAAHEFLTQVLEEAAMSSVPLLLERAQLSPYDAIADLGTILKLESSNLVALQMRGEVLYSSLDAALTHYRQGLHSDPEHKGLKKLYRQLKKLLKFMGNAEDEMTRGEFAEAAEDWQAALEVDEAHPLLHKDLYLQLCQCQLKLKKYAEAQRSCEQVIAIDDGVALAFAKLSEAQQGLEQFEDAVRSAKRALELDDSSREFKEGVNRAEAALKQSKNKNYYKILGVARDAAPKEIKKAYRKMALEWHPDKHADKDESEREQVQKRFHDIAEAYEILSDEETRARYDRGEDVAGNGAGQQQQGRPFNPFGNGNFFQQGGRTFHFNFG